MVNDEAQTNSGLTEKELSKLDYVEFALDSRTSKVIDDRGWEAYYQVLEVVTNVKKGDLSFFNDNDEAITLLLDELKESVPNQLNKPATLARIRAFETKLYKLESLSNLHTTTKKELTDTIKEFLVAFSNLNFQMNKRIEKDMQKILKP